MRVIHTSMFFETGDVKGWERHRRERMRPPFEKEDAEPGLAFAWFRSGLPGPYPSLHPLHLAFLSEPRELRKASAPSSFRVSRKRGGLVQ